MNCIICNQEIENDSQFINGNWYHNKCIENQQKEIERLNNIINTFEEWLNDLGAWCYVEKLKELRKSDNNE